MNTSVDANSQELERNTGALQGTRRALNSLTSAAQRAAQITGILGELPDSLGEVTQGLGSLNKAISVYETRFQVLQNLTRYGVNFGYSMEEMERSANTAGYSLTNLANLVDQRGRDMALLGENVNNAIETFLNRNASIYSTNVDNFTSFGMNLNETLRSFGLNADEIRTTLENFETLYQTGLVARFRDDRQRNQIALEYFTVLDDLARLTGKQRDQVAEELAENARRGQVQARAMTISDPELRQTYRNELGAMRSILGDTAGALAEDILGPGSPQTRASAEFSVAADEYTNLLYEARRQLEAGQTTAFRETMRRAQVAAMAARNEDNATMAMYRARSSYGDVIGRFFEESYQAANQFENIRERLRGTSNRIVSDQEVVNEINRMFNQSREDRARAFREGDPNDLFSNIARTNNQIFTDAQQARERMINLAYDNITGVINGLNSAFRAANLGDRVTEFGNLVQSILTAGVGGPDTAIGAEAERARLDALALQTPEGVDIAAQIAQQMDILRGNANASDRAQAEQRLAELLAQTRTLQRANITVQAADVTLNVTDLELINALRLQQGLNPVEETQGQSIGTLGNFGRLFRDFGTESMVPLHGIEAVLTPRQLGEVVNIAVGNTLDAAGRSIGNRQSPALAIPASFTTSIQSLDGRLNTLSNRLPQLAQNNTTIDLSPLERAIMQLPSQMKRPFEEAISTIGSEMEKNGQLLGEIAYNTDRTTRNTRGISGDYMRGA